MLCSKLSRVRWRHQVVNFHQMYSAQFEYLQKDVAIYVKTLKRCN